MHRARPRACAHAAARVCARAMQLACAFLIQNGAMFNRKPNGGKPNIKVSFMIPRDGHTFAMYMETYTTCIVRAARAAARVRARTPDAACMF